MQVRIPSPRWLARRSTPTDLARSVALGAAAVAAMLAIRAVLIRILPNPGLLGNSPFSLAYLAVICASLWGGLIAGVTAAALAEASIIFVFHRAGLTAGQDYPRLILFGVVSLVIVTICWLARRARRDAEEALAERDRAEQRMRERLESIHDGFAAVDRQWRITYVNRSFEELYGRRREELLGKTVWESFPKMVGTELERQFRHAMEQQTAVRFETISPTRGRWIQSGAFPSPEGLSIYVQDIDDRRRAEDALRQSEERYRQLVETAQEGIWMIDAEARTSYVNPAMAEMLGYAPREMIGRPMAEFMDEAALAEATANVARGRKGGSGGNGNPAAVDAGASSYDLRFRRRDGSDFHAHVSATPIRGPGGEYVGTLAMVSDVSERRRAEQERTELLIREQKARAEAEAANRRKDQFLAVLSHELRTPLTPVLARLALMKREPGLSASLASGLDLIRRNVELEARLIDDLLDVTRLARGQLKLHLDDIDAHERVEAALAIYEAEIRSRRQTVSVELKAQHPFVRGDGVRLQQIFWNLIGNAVKYTPPGGRITIRSSNVRTDPAREKLVVQVIDNGAGIDPNLMPRLFDPFEQGEQTLARRHGGLGLGLSISRTLAQMHGGTITAESAGPGFGSAFSVELPTVPAPRPGTPTEVKPQAPAAPPAATGVAAGQRILLVDDNEDTLQVMARLLRSSGHQVNTADSVSSALAAASHPFDVLITDIGLPDGTGWELLRQLRQRNGDPNKGPPLRAIAISGFSMDEDVRRSRDSGFVKHLAKPINPEDLEAAISRAVTATAT